MKAIFTTAVFLLGLIPDIAHCATGGQVVQIISPQSPTPRLLISVGSKNGVAAGDVLMVDRPVPGTMDRVSTGRIKVLEVYQNQSLCDIVSEETPASRAIFGKFPRIMAGDLVALEQVRLAAVGQIIPEIVTPYTALFVDPKANPSTLELSLTGKKELERIADEFATRRVESMVIEAHTDEAGPSDLNQIESYQRALTIKQFLVGQYGFNEDRLIVIGQGENERLEDEATMIPGHTTSARRVVFRSVE